VSLPNRFLGYFIQTLNAELGQDTLRIILLKTGLAPGLPTLSRPSVWMPILPPRPMPAYRLLCALILGAARVAF
jgi:hypothetical protein